MQAITTKILPATSTKPTRIKAVCARGSAIISYPDAANQEDAHRIAAENLVHRFAREDAKKYGTPYGDNPWIAPRACGQTVSGDYVHVFTK